MLSRGPVFQVIAIDLSADGTKVINDLVSTVQFVRAEYASGALALLTRVNVQMGDVGADVLPTGINTTINAQTPTPCVTFSWSAQPGVTAYFMLAYGRELMVHSPPASQLVTQSMGANLTAVKTTAGIAATKIDAGGTVQTRTIRNNSATGGPIVYLGGDATVLASSGYPLAPGEVITLSGTSSAVWAIATAVGADIRIMTEA